jgi:hypothetical protein
MQQKTLTSQASFAGQIEREESVDPMERMESATEPGHATLDDLRSFAWRGVKLSSSFLQRWLNLCEVGVEEVFFALTMLRLFSGVNLDPVTAPQETSALDSHRLMEEHDFLQPDNSPGFSGSPSNPAISWKTPWLYLILLLLVWLLLF